MKYLKMLGLAAVAAMALMAFVGAGSASATVLCKTTPVESTCSPEWDYAAGTTIDFSLEPGTSAILRNTESSIVDTCNVSTVTGSTTNTGSATETVDGEVAAGGLTWGKAENCTNETKTTLGGKLIIHWIPGTHNGTVTAEGFDVDVAIFGTQCAYGTGATARDLGVYNSETKTIKINTTLEKVTNNFLCPSTAVWEASYILTSPEKLYVAERT